MAVTINGSASADFATALPLTEGGTGAGSAAAAAATIAPIQLQTAVATTSGATIDFTSIPAGVKRITVMLSSVSSNGTSDFAIQLGDAGGFETSGYLANSFYYTETPAIDNIVYTTAFGLSSGITAGKTFTFKITLDLMNVSAFTWISNHIGQEDSGFGSQTGGGSKSLSAELTQVRLTTVGGSNTFDAGSVAISWEF